MIKHILESWYAENKRELPFREIRDPYALWVAEIIFQQTRIRQGINYYHRFMESFPDIASLAAASSDQVLKVWQGLGYYQRAKNMHQAAKTLMEKGGEFPKAYADILAIKGIGNYTAAAIASQAFDILKPAVDGNVFRFLSRFYGIHESRNSRVGEEKAEERALKLLNPENPGRSNQALIEFGALQCTPARPNCESCPLKTKCYAYDRHLVHALPVKVKKPGLKSRYLHYDIPVCQGYTLLSPRAEGDIWAGLWEFPLTEASGPNARPELPFPAGSSASPRDASQKFTHVLSHQKLFITCTLHFTNKLPDLPSYIQIPVKKVVTYPMPVVLSRYWLKVTSSGYLDGEANI